MLYLKSGYGEQLVGTEVLQQSMERNWILVGPVDDDGAPSDDDSREDGEAAPLAALVTFDTNTFRRMVRRVKPTDVVLEIGSSWGKCTALLGEALCSPGRVVGIDTSKEAVERCRDQYPHLKFERADALATPRIVIEIVERLLAVARASLDDGGGSSAKGKALDLVVFVDIGGNREIEALVALLPWCAQSLPLVPRLIVVKSETLYCAVQRTAGVFDWPALRAAHGATQFRRQRLPHPLKAPLRLTEDGTPICRFHNYRATSCREGDECPFNHTICHLCLRPGHTALECSQEDAVPL